jgi:hypothetical protein
MWTIRRGQQPDRDISDHVDITVVSTTVLCELRHQQSQH